MFRHTKTTGTLCEHGQRLCFPHTALKHTPTECCVSRGDTKLTAPVKPKVTATLSVAMTPNNQRIPQISHVPSIDYASRLDEFPPRGLGIWSFSFLVKSLQKVMHCCWVAVWNRYASQCLVAGLSRRRYHNLEKLRNSDHTLYNSTKLVNPAWPSELRCGCHIDIIKFRLKPIIVKLIG